MNRQPFRVVNAETGDEFDVDLDDTTAANVELFARRNGLTIEDALQLLLEIGIRRLEDERCN